MPTDMPYSRADALVVQRAYTYDILGRPTARDLARYGTQTSDTFGYNTRSELTTARVNSANYSYAYDAIGNRTATTEAGTRTTYTANKLNQYTAEGSFRPTFDADGNQTLIKTSTGTWNVTYNAKNRPILFAKSDGSVTVECTYDTMGRRATKKVTTNGTLTEHRRFLYRGYLQIACCDLTRAYTPALWFITWESPRRLGGGLDKHEVFAPKGRAGNGVPASQPTQDTATRPLAIQKNGTWYTYGWDLTKNICETYRTDARIDLAYTYTPYGEVSPAHAYDQPLRWSSEYHDVELGLVYYNYRHYDPAVGRWMGRDFLMEEHGKNLFNFLSNTPVNRRDYLGLLWKLWHRSNKKNDAAFDDLASELKKLCSNGCCHSQSKISECEINAEIIAQNIKLLWIHNWGKGPYQDKNIFGTDLDPVGGYLCWDWADAFTAVGNTHGGRTWEAETGTMRPIDTEINLIHYFTWFCACGCNNDNCCLAIDDGYLNSKFIHTFDDDPSFFGDEDWELVPYKVPNIKLLKPMKVNNDFYNPAYTITEKD